MKLEQLILTLGGIAIIVALFIPYIELPGEMFDQSSEGVRLTGIEFVQTMLAQFGVSDYKGGEKLTTLLSTSWGQAKDFKGLGLVIGLLFVLGGPVWFGFHALGYIWKGLRGRQYSRGIFFTILFLGFSWLIFWLWGNSKDAYFNFFTLAMGGFWIGFGGMMLAAVSLFFEKK